MAFRQKWYACFHSGSAAVWNSTAAAALTAFVDAVERRDTRALEQLAPAELPSARELLSAVATNVRSLDLTAVSARYVDQVGAVAEDGSWTGVAELTWQLRGEAGDRQVEGGDSVSGGVEQQPV